MTKSGLESLGSRLSCIASMFYSIVPYIGKFLLEKVFTKPDSIASIVVKFHQKYFTNRNSANQGHYKLVYGFH